MLFVAVKPVLIRELTTNAIDETVKSQNTHYIPEWVLKRFRDPILLELDIFTGLTKPRNPGRAGSGQDLWPEDIEDGLSVHDNAAARIFRNKINGREAIFLTHDERMQFALWLSQFAVRVPDIREHFRHHLEEERKNPEFIRNVVRKNVHHFVESARRSDPEAFDELVDDLGMEEVERWIVDGCTNQIAVTGQYLPTYESLHHYYMRNNSSEKYAAKLCEYHWSWYRTQSAFVIGDNPLIRWHEKSQRWNYGIKRPGVEITMPITVNLCLRLTRTIRRNPEQVKRCTERQTRIFNVRQRLAAVRCVYGNSPDALDFIHKPMVGWNPR